MGEDSTTCADPSAFCLISCNVGCVQNGCELRNIAQNHELRFQFSEVVDPATVDFTTIVLKTSLGETPVGEFVAEGSMVTFLPGVRTVGATTFFGFQPNQEYILTLPGGPDAGLAVRSLNGRPLQSQFSCTLTASEGVLDIDGQPPTGELVTPANGMIVDPDAEFVVRFSELVDHSPFLNEPDGPGAPVRFSVVSSVDGTCQFGTDAQPVFGSVRLDDDIIGRFTSMTFTPDGVLPRGSCVVVELTPIVTDVAGTAAEPRQWVVRTDPAVEEGFIEETFDTPTMLDGARSGGVWGGGVASFLRLGGDGRHGDFLHTLGERDGATDEWVFDTDEPWVGDSSAYLRADEADGEYHFTRFIVPSGVTVRFTGSHAPIIHVRGECSIRGNVVCSGRDVQQYLDLRNQTSNQVGQSGGQPGPGGGFGGGGGTQCDGFGADPDFDGQNGSSVIVRAGHGYAGFAADTAGQGSTIEPSDGQSSSVMNQPGTVGASNVANGGGGGGFVTPGGEGFVVEVGQVTGWPFIAQIPVELAAGGAALPMLPPLAASSLDNFLVGGSGGGGGASHPFLGPSFLAGAAGAGGGGAIALRVGGDFTFWPSASIEARGGSAFRLTEDDVENNGYACPGGGGAGGSVLIQVLDESSASLRGTIDVRGGSGGAFISTDDGIRGHVEGGDGGDGFVRVETPSGVDSSSWEIAAFPAAIPESGGVLTDEDARGGFMSKYYSTGLAAPPRFKRYEVHAILDGIPVIYSDDPVLGVAATTGEAVEFFVQGIAFDPSTGVPVAGAEPTAWFGRVKSSTTEGAFADVARTGFRFQVVANHEFANTIEIDRVSVVFDF